jgi:hypothetical protein
MAYVRRLLPLGLAAAVAAFLSTPAGAELAKWDQARVTGIGQQLAAACDAWEQALRKQPGGAMLGSGDAQDYLVMQQGARLLREQSKSLAAHLEDGKGHDRTVHSYQALKEAADDTEVSARRASLDEPALDAWARVADLLRQIAPYYDPKALDEARKPD